MQNDRAFRHVVIHRYGFELRSDRVVALVDQLADCHNALAENVRSFCDFLQAIDQAL